jgi:hypothetical protein
MRVIDQPKTSCYGRVALARNIFAGTLKGFPYPPAKDFARPSRASSTRSLPLFGLALFLASTGGCGPVEYINQVGNKAASAVSAAKLAQSDRYAPYEYTSAEEYLHKAREEAGHAEYGDAIEYGRKAEEWANRARAITVERLAKDADVAPPYKPKSANEEPGAGDADPAAAAKQRARESDAKTPGSE